MVRKVFEGGHIVDLEKGTTAQQSLVVEDERITSIGDVEKQSNDQVIDVSDKYLLPGFVNSHVHLGWDGIHDLQVQANESSATSAMKAAMNVRKNLSAGVTTIRDLGMNDANQSAKHGIDTGVIPWIRLLINGRAIATTGGHTWWCCREADGVDDCRRAIREQFKVGAEWIKIMGSHELVQFTMDELRAMVDEAHLNGLKVTAHATFDEAIRRVVEAGVDCVEHGGSMSDETIQLLVDRGTPIVTTFSPLVLQSQRGLDWGMPPHEVQRRIDQVNDESRFAGNKAAAEAGITIVFGTDAGSPVVPHNEIAEELKFMVKVGVCKDNYDALRSITIRGAKLLGLGEDLGSLEVGKVADVVVLDRNPGVDLEAVREVSQVYVRGQLAHSATGGYAQAVGPPLAAIAETRRS
ncbi:MAG: amidohydrolase family protein [Acidimicrobiia bacterium]|nr:amidohydrolase family protein [Acidimicrobiia bacterium]